MRLLFGVLLLAGLGAAPAAPALAQSDAAEIEFWQSVKDSKSVIELEAYLQAYPDGKFAPIARLRLNKLKSKAARPAGPNAKTGSHPASTASKAADTEKDIEASLRLFGDILERIRADYGSKVDYPELIKSAVTQTLERFPSAKGARVTKGPAARRCQGQKKIVIYQCLDLIGDVFYAQFRDHPGEAEEIVLASIDGLLASLKDQAGGTISPATRGAVQRLLVEADLQDLD